MLNSQLIVVQEGLNFVLSLTATAFPRQWFWETCLTSLYTPQTVILLWDTS